MTRSHHKGSNPRVAIIGAGIGGIATAVELRRAGVHTFTVFEKSEGPGGTWRDNTYPGAACDVASHLYSFSFTRKTDWTRVCSSQVEILAYLEQIVDDYGIRPACRFGIGVDRIVWDDVEQVWELTTDTGATERFDVVVSCLGLLNVPRIPDLPGLAEFAGPAFHTARWEHEHDLAGKRVAVIGTGSTAAQVVPSIAGDVEHLHVYQREPGWIVPKEDRAFSAAELRRFKRFPLLVRWRRLQDYARREMGSTFLNPDSRMNQKLTSIALDFLQEAVHDPAVREQLTPAYPYGCKRPMKDNNYYPAFNRANVELVPHAVTSVVGDGVVAADGQTRPADVLVLSTGFAAVSFLSTLEVVGRDGARLHETWDAVGGPEAFLGMTVSGFPNFFMLYGPNTNSSTTSLIFVLECQARYAVRAVRRMARRGVTSVELRPAAQRRFNRWLHAKMPRTAWTAGCHNYYETASGKLVTNWPHTSILYWTLTRLLAVGFPFLYRERRPRATERQR